MKQVPRKIANNQVNMSDVEEMLTVYEAPSSPTQMPDLEKERDPLTSSEEEEVGEKVELIEMKGLANTQQMWEELYDKIETTAVIEQTTKDEKKMKKKIAPTTLKRKVEEMKQEQKKKSPTKKSKTVSFRKPVVIELTKEQQQAKWEQQDKNMLAILCLMWEIGETFPLLLTMFQALGKHALREGDVSLKQKCMIWRQGVTDVKARITSLTSDEKYSRDLSFGRFKKLLAETESYMMFIKENLPETMIKEIFSIYNKLSSGEQYSSLPPTVTTGTSSMTAHTQAVNVDVPEVKQSPVATEIDLREGLFGPSTLPQNTVSIQSSISALVNGKLTTYKSGTTPAGADLVVKFEMYPLDKVRNIEANQWWKHALVRAKCSISSGAEVQLKAEEFQKALERHFSRNLAPLQREEREIGTWRS